MITHVRSLGFALRDTRGYVFRTDTRCSKSALQGGDREKGNEE
jgi:hypothetical protein